MNIKKRPTIIVEELGVNPFSFNLQVPVKQMEFKKQYIKDAEGNLTNVTAEVEAVEICKFYCSPENRKIRNAFSLRAKEMYLWLLDEIEYGKDYIWINKDRYMKEMNISSMNTYKDALNELIRYGHLTETITKGVYWINPEFFFKGNRITKYPKNIKVQYSKEQEFEKYLSQVNEPYLALTE